MSLLCLRYNLVYLLYFRPSLDRSIINFTGVTLQCFKFLTFTVALIYNVTSLCRNSKQSIWKLNGSYHKSKLELKSNLNEILPVNCKFSCVHIFPFLRWKSNLTTSSLSFDNLSWSRITDKLAIFAWVRLQFKFAFIIWLIALPITQ